MIRLKEVAEAMCSWPSVMVDAVKAEAWLILDNGKGAADTMVVHQGDGFKLVGLCERIRIERKSDGTDVSKRYGCGCTHPHSRAFDGGNAARTRSGQVNAGAMALFPDRSMSRVVCSSSGLIPSRSITKDIWTRRSVLLYTARAVCVLPWRRMCCRNWGTRMWLTWRWGTTRGKKPVVPGRKCLFQASCARDKVRQLHIPKTNLQAHQCGWACNGKRGLW